MQTPLFLSSRQAAELLGFPLKFTLEALAAHGIPCIDLGPGRGRGLRFRRQDVTALADTLQAEAHQQHAMQRQPGHPILGKTLGELYKSLKQ